MDVFFLQTFIIKHQLRNIIQFVKYCLGLVAEEEKRQKALKTKKDLKIFWKDIITLLQKAPEGSKLHDLARLEYIVKTETMPKNTEDADEKVTYLSNIERNVFPKLWPYLLGMTLEQCDNISLKFLYYDPKHASQL